MIEIINVSKEYGKTPALNNVCLCIPKGQVIGLFGENGAGKSTLIKCIMGYVRFKGDILLDGERISHKNISKISFATGEHSFFPGLNALSHMEFYKEHFLSFNSKRFRALMDFFQLPYKRNIGKLSTGQMNQFEVIMALSQGAEYILMDEPFIGNDVFNRQDFYKVLMGILEPDETILIATHLIEEIENVIGRAILIKNGSIVGDVSTEELEDKNKSLMEFIKEAYNYRPDRVSQALAEMPDK